MIARLRWADGKDIDVQAVAIAWTSDAVEIQWEKTAGVGVRADWVPATHVRRPEAPEPENMDAPSTRGWTAKTNR